VHYNSNKPAQLKAHAYAQGNDIHVAPGQERHLPHEAWHVVQQKQGRVKPTTQVGNVSVNDNAGLEREADVMGDKAVQMKAQSNEGGQKQGGNQENVMSSTQPIQRKLYTLGEMEDEPNSISYEEAIEKIQGVLNPAIALDLKKMEQDGEEHIFNKTVGGKITLDEANNVILSWLRKDDPIYRQVKDITKIIDSGEKVIPDEFQDIPKEELAAIIGHSMQGYLVNADLRKAVPNDQDKRNLSIYAKQIDNTKKGLEKIPPYVGWVYRGQAIPDSMEGDYAQGETLVFRGFTSTTKSASVSDQFKPSDKAHEVSQMLTIYSTTGRDISKIAHDETEQEVLFPPGAEFKVHKVTKDVGKPDEIVLIQTKDSPDVQHLDIPNRKAKVQEENEQLQLEKEQQPDPGKMLVALMTKGIDPSGCKNPEELLVLYKQHF
jgi:hypothetical protein